jgi:hypothetical protein
VVLAGFVRASRTSPRSGPALAPASVTASAESACSILNRPGTSWKNPTATRLALRELSRSSAGGRRPRHDDEPPDFDRRRRVPIADIYVPPTIYENTYAERTLAPVPADPHAQGVGAGTPTRPDGPTGRPGRRQNDLAAAGQHLLAHPSLPWVYEEVAPWSTCIWRNPSSGVTATTLDEIPFLGAAAALLISAGHDPVIPSRYFEDDAPPGWRETRTRAAVDVTLDTAALPVPSG